MPEFCWILRDHPGDREQNIVNDGAIQFLPAEEQFDSTGLFHWCTARPFNEVILVGCFIRRLFIPQHDHVMKWKHFPRYWPFVRGIHRSPVNSPHKGQWRGALMFSLICVWINDWVNNREAGDLRRYRAHCDCNEQLGSFSNYNFIWLLLRYSSIYLWYFCMKLLQ